MKKYLVECKFMVGEASKYLYAGDIVYYDGKKAVVNEEEFKVSSFDPILKMGWMRDLSDDPGDVVVTDKSTVHLSENLLKRLDTGSVLDKYETVEYSSGEEVADTPGPRKAKKAKPLFNINLPVLDQEPDYIGDIPSSKKKASKKSDLSINMPVTEIDGDEIGSNKKVEGTKLEIPKMEVKFEEGEKPPKLKRKPKKVEPKNLGDTESKTELKGAGIVDDIDDTGIFKNTGFEIMGEESKLPSNEENVNLKGAGVSEFVELSDLAGFEFLGQKSSTEKFKEDWTKMSFQQKKSFVDDSNDKNLLEVVSRIEQGAIKKFVNAKLKRMK